MLKKFMFLGGCLLTLIGLLPPAVSLYQFTGEETFLSQARGSLQWAYTAIRPAPQLRPFPGDVDSADASTDVPPFGMNVFLQTEPLPEVRDETLRMVKAAGFGLIRQQFVWEDIEIHAKGDFEDRRNVEAIGVVNAWVKYDNIVELAEKHDLEILARIDNPPTWTRAMTNTIGTLAPPDNYADYGDFVEAVVSRYDGRITYFQLWNEPNIYPEWGEQWVDPEAYTALMCEGYRRAKAVNPDAVILSGTMAPTVALNYRDLNDLIYLERMYAAGAADCFDILSVQGYGLWSGPTDQRLRPTVINYPHNLLLRDVMVANGDAHKPIWISEFGWNSVPDGLPQSYGQVSEEQKGRYALDGYERQLREWPWVEAGAYWFIKRPTDTEVNEPFYYFRLLEPNFEPLESYTIIADRLPSLEPVAPRSALWHSWQGTRRYFALSGLALLIFSVTLWIAKEEEEKE
ncbi:MAG: hypothetical protein AAF633_17600 [Chloroflexota bacterium]